MYAINGRTLTLVNGRTLDAGQRPRTIADQWQNNPGPQQSPCSTRAPPRAIGRPVQASRCCLRSIGTTDLLDPAGTPRRGLATEDPGRTTRHTSAASPSSWAASRERTRGIAAEWPAVGSQEAPGTIPPSASGARTSTGAVKPPPLTTTSRVTAFAPSVTETIASATAISRSRVRMSPP